jgi:hypothetical protein
MTRAPDKTWQDALIERYPELFEIKVADAVTTPGWPEVGNGWQDLVETAVGRIAAAVSGQPIGGFQVGQIKTKFGSLRVYLSCAGLAAGPQAAVNEAIALACARSACTCETCGRPGRLHDRMGWLVTACDEHAVGRAVAVHQEWENIHIVRGMRNGQVTILSCRRYDRAADTFHVVTPSELGIEE